MLFSALLDANVLVPSKLSNLCLCIAERELYRPLWSPDVLDEVRRTVKQKWPDANIDRRIAVMNSAFDDALVTGYEHLVPTMTMTRDPDDRHVIAAAVAGRADVIVTTNLADFPKAPLAALKIDVQSPDEFLNFQLDLSPDEVCAALDAMAARTGRAGKPAESVSAILQVLQRSGAQRFANRARVMRRRVTGG